MKKTLSLTLAVFMLLSTISIGVSASSVPSDWAMNEVDNAINAGIITNAITKNYQKDITREEFCELVVKLYESLTNESAASGKDVFTDTDNREILKAYNLGIVKGVSNNEFAPYNNITRQEICVMLVRCVDVAIEGANINDFSNNNFADKNKISDWAIDYVNYAYDKGIMKGIGNNNISPLGNTTCEQAVLLAYRIYENKDLLSVYFEEISEKDAKKISSLIDEVNILDNENAEQQEVVEFLDDVEWIENITETADGGVSCRTEFGITCVWTPYEENKIGSGNTVNSSIQNNTVSNSDIHEVSNIVVLCPYASTDSNFNLDGYNYIGEIMEEYAGSSVTFLEDDEVSLATLKNLDQYDMVWFYSHGALSNVTNSAWAILDSDPYTMTGEFADSINKYIWLSEDFFYGRTIVNLSDGRIGVGGKFYEHYYSENELDNTFFHFASCNSMKTDKLANGILSRGAEWVEGYTNSVYFNNDYMHFVGVIASLVEGKNIQESISVASKTVKDTYDFWQEDCQLKGMGNSNYRIKSAVETSHTYYAFDNSLTWNEAKKYCEKLGGYLATITSYGEQQEINNLISDKGKNVYWLGGTNSQNDGSWKWITSEDWNYTNWGEGEPNNSRNDESYLEIIRVPFDKIKYGEWNDMSNDGDSSHCSLENHGFVCEWDKVLSEQKIQELIINASDEYNGHHYMFFENAATWEEAQDFCESMGGHLATITSEGENDFLFELMKTSGYDSAYFGFTDSYEEGEWAWITGERVRYTNWHSGEPNSENSNEDYAMFYFKFDDGTWNDGDFGGGTVQGGNVFICEWD